MLKKGAMFLVIFALLGINNSQANTLIERTINGYKAKIIEYKTDSKLYDIKIGVHPKDGGTLRSIMSEVGGITGVNGVFECPKDYPSCGGKNYTINERYVNGEKKGKYKSTGDRVVFGWDKEVKPFLFQTDIINKNREKDIWEGFANHPLLLKNGETQTHIYHEKGLINSKMKAKATKNFICSNKSGDTIYFGMLYRIDIDTAAIVLKGFGCWNAINLDAGASTTFIYNGKYILNPQRDILDGVFIVPKDIDTKKIEQKAKKIIKNILKKISYMSSSQKQERLRQLNEGLNNVSQKIYKNNTSNVYEDIKIYKNELIIPNISADLTAQNFIKTDSFKKSKALFIKADNIYKKVAVGTKRKLVGTKTQINSNKTLEKIYLINLLRTYTKELERVYTQLKKLEYIKKLDLNLKIN